MFYFFKTYIFWRAGRGKISGKKNCYFLTYIFWRAGRGKIGGKKNWTTYKFFFLNLYFLEGWSLEDRRQKKLNKI